MVALTWDTSGNRTYETGVDHGVLYVPNGSGAYVAGYAWNGLVSVTEQPSGAESSAQYADNIKYLNLVSAEEFKATIEAFTYPKEFEPFDGLGVPQAGIAIAQQSRGVFGLSYRTRMGNDLSGTSAGYKLHLLYGAQASPSEKAYTTVNDSPEAITFSWEVATTPVVVTGYTPSSLITIDSTKVNSAALATLESFLYGTSGTDPSLPSPDAVLALFAGTITEVTPTAPTYVNGTHTLTIPSVTGVTYRVNGITITSGDHVITADTVVVATPNNGYKFPAIGDDDWFFDYS
jgi:hypothetical protein